MSEVRNLNHKLVGAISTDKRVFEIQLKDCVTQIKVKPDGTLGFIHRKQAVSRRDTRKIK